MWLKGGILHSSVLPPYCVTWNGLDLLRFQVCKLEVIFLLWLSLGSLEADPEIRIQVQDFCGGPVVRTPCFQCRGRRFDSWWGKQDSTCCMLSFSCSVVSDFATHGLQCARLPCPSPSPGVCSNSCPLSR